MTLYHLNTLLFSIDKKFIVFSANITPFEAATKTSIKSLDRGKWHGPHKN